MAAVFGYIHFMHHLELWLIHPKREACSAFQARFKGLQDFIVQQARYEDLPPHDCFVTAGNAYGIMTAGIDAAVINLLGSAIMHTVQSRIVDEYLGEQPVGTAFVIESGKPDRPYLCHAPTMRTPGSIEGTDKVYAASWAALIAVYQFNIHLAEQKKPSIRTVAMPAMGAGFGGLSYDESARQMAAAYEHYLNLPTRKPDWDWVTDREKNICYDGTKKVCR